MDSEEAIEVSVFGHLPLAGTSTERLFNLIDLELERLDQHWYHVLFLSKVLQTDCCCQVL